MAEVKPKEELLPCLDSRGGVNLSEGLFPFGAPPVTNHAFTIAP